jgi:hypothetical protein
MYGEGWVKDNIRKTWEKYENERDVGNTVGVKGWEVMMKLERKESSEGK